MPHHELCDVLTSESSIVLRHNGGIDAGLHEIAKKQFWQSLAVQDVDVVFLPISQDDMVECSPLLIRQKLVWQYQPFAVVAVISDPTIDMITKVSQMGFDGIVTEPFDVNQIMNQITIAKINCQKRQRTITRQKKLKSLCKSQNQKRHHLRQQVDMLCNDFVGSNKKLAQTLNELKYLCEFQSELMGENDLYIMLHRAMQWLLNDMTNTCGAVYHFDNEQFEAHISNAWSDSSVDVDSIESFLKFMVVDEVKKTRKPLLVKQGRVKTSDENVTQDLAVMAIPIMNKSKIVGLLLFYRDSQVPFTKEALDQVRPLATPLGRQMTAIQKLQAFINS